MNIQEQKQLADWVLRKLNPHYSILLAGGAPRDWYFGKPGNDLDFFIAGEADHEFVMNELLIGLSPVSTKEYENSPFIVYEGMVDEQVIQFIFQPETSAREIVKRFPCAMSWAWYDGECHYDKLFEIGAKYQILIWPEGIDWSAGRYVDKLFRKFPAPAWRIGGSVDRALQEIGNPPIRVAELEMPEEEMPANEPLHNGFENVWMIPQLRGRGVNRIWADDPFAV